MILNGLKIYAGEIFGHRSKSYMNRETGAEEVTHYLQFIEQRPDGSIDKQEVKLPLGISLNSFPKGQLVALPVAIAAYKDNVYLRIDKDMFTPPVMEALKALTEAMAEELAAA